MNLDDIINNNKLIEGIAIEFHDADLHTDKIINFINKINLSLVHVHLIITQPMEKVKSYLL